MARSGNQKQKILYLVQMLAVHQDEDHVLSMKEIVEELENKGIRSERKSIYDDMEALREFGIPIKYSRKRPGGYYVAGRMPEHMEVLPDWPVADGEEAVGVETWKDEGVEKEVKLSCPTAYCGRVAAYLNGPVEWKEKKDGMAQVSGKCVIGRGFFGWLTYLGPEVRLLKPRKAAAAYREYLKEIIKRYKEK
ncbi:MAG: hypothetical protein ACOYBE_02085 [Blautia sp.]